MASRKIGMVLLEISYRVGAKGFTLIEMLITVAIAAIMASIALPSFSEFITSNNVTAQANQFITALNYARSEAIRRGAPVCIARAGGTTSDWTAGWTIYADGTTSRIVAKPTDVCNVVGTILQRQPALTEGMTLTADTNVERAIRFNALGVAVNQDDIGISGSFSLCRRDRNAARSKRIDISITGIAQINGAQPTCN